MSLLRNVLKKNKDVAESNGVFGAPPSTKSSSVKAPNLNLSFTKKNKSSAASFVSRATTIQSIQSFYTAVLGGSKQAKRRRPDILKFGAPAFYHDTPPPSQPVPGTERVDVAEFGDYETIHATSFPDVPGDAGTPNAAAAEPYATLILASHAKKGDKRPVYYDGDIPAGEVRIRIDESESRVIRLVKISFVGRMTCDLEWQGEPMFAHAAELWSAKKGDPSQQFENKGKGAEPFKKIWPAGTYVFPFSFPPFRRDVHIRMVEEAQRKNKGETRVDLPPTFNMKAVGGMSGSISYKFKVTIEYGASLKSILAPLPDTFNNEVFYLPRTRPIPRTVDPFPFLPSREDWPLNREDVGGWCLTPFGGRGRFDGRMVEFEGILGVPAHPVFAWDETIPYHLILWSSDEEALEALSDPSSVTAVFCSNEVYAKDALVPRTEARRSRKVTKLGDAKVWKIAADGSRVESMVPSTDAAAKPLTATPSDPSSAPSLTSAASDFKTEYMRSTAQKASPLSMNTITEADEDEDNPVDNTLQDTDQLSDEDKSSNEDLTETVVGSPTSPQPSLTPTSPIDSALDDDVDRLSLGDDSEDMPESSEKVVRLEGEVSARPARWLPSFNYKYMNRNYMLKIFLTHPKYNHISPAALGPYSEAPLWITTDSARTMELPEATANTDPGSLSPNTPPVTSSNSSSTAPRVLNPEALRTLPIIGRTINLPSTSQSNAELPHSINDASKQVDRDSSAATASRGGFKVYFRPLTAAGQSADPASQFIGVGALGQMTGHNSG